MDWRIMNLKLGWCFRNPNEIFKTCHYIVGISVGKVTVCKNLWWRHISFVPVGKLFPFSESQFAYMDSRIYWTIQTLKLLPSLKFNDSMNPCIWNERNPKYLTYRFEAKNLIEVICLVPIMQETVLTTHIDVLWSSVIQKLPSLHKDLSLSMFTIIKVLIFTSKNSLQGTSNRYSDLKKTVSNIV